MEAGSGGGSIQRRGGEGAEGREKEGTRDEAQRRDKARVQKH